MFKFHENNFVIPQSSSSISSEKIKKMEHIIGQDEGQRGIQSLIVPGDLERAAIVLTNLKYQKSLSIQFQPPNLYVPQVIILSGFPCCVDYDPPTETDGPPGAMAIAKCCIALGYTVTLVTDDCNKKVFEAAASGRFQEDEKFCICTFPSQMSSEDRIHMASLAKSCDVIISCERPGPAADGICRTMRGIDMNAKHLVAPLHEIVDIAKCRQDKLIPYIAIGDGGNELGMGKVIDIVREKIPNGTLIAAVTVADFLITASISNWGAYALCAACSVLMNQYEATSVCSVDWKYQCMPTTDDEVVLLNRCVLAGCRDGISGRLECTVDGLPMEHSLICLQQLMSVI